MTKADERGQLMLQAGPDTEELVSFITRNLDDDVLDTIDVERITAGEALASEPITTAALMYLSPVAVYAVLRLLEKWMEARRQADVRESIIATWAVDPKLGKALARLETTHAGVVVKQGMPDVRFISRPPKEAG
jgi:hypothetical protein